MWAVEKVHPIWRTDLGIWHTVMLDQAGFGLRSAGYILGVEKRLLTDRAVTHLVRYPQAGSGPSGSTPRPCVLRTTLLPSEREKERIRLIGEATDWGLYDVCDNRTHERYTPDVLRDAVARDLRTGAYTHMIVIIMGWNTRQAEAVRNYNAIVTNLAAEAHREQPPSFRFNPLVIGITWPSEWSLDPGWSVVPAQLVQALSFFTKKEQAEDIGTTFIIPTIEQALLAARADAGLDDQVPLVAIGHSFGARALVAGMRNMQSPDRPAVGRYTARDRLVLLQGAGKFEDMFDQTSTVARKPLLPRLRDAPLRVIMTASAHDSAAGATLWGWYTGDVDTFRRTCALLSQPGNADPVFGDYDLSAFGCGLAYKPGAWGHGLCAKAGERPTEADLALVMSQDAKVRYWDASWLINCGSSLYGGGAHSDLYRREFGRFLWSEIDSVPPPANPTPVRRAPRRPG